MELAVVGNEEFALGFRLVGIRKVYSCTNDMLGERVNDVLKDEDVGILVLHEHCLSNLPPLLVETLRDSVRPVLITVGEEEEDLREKIRRVIGIDLYSENRT
jgi:V/A-type H+-transporting ATPase subunit F